MKSSRTLAILALGLNVAACSSGPNVDNEQSASDIYMKKGVQYLENGQLDIALQDLKHAIQLNSHNSEAHNYLAVLYQRLNQLDEAEQHFKTAMSLDEKNVGAANNYGRFLCAQGKYEQAMKLFLEVIDSKLYQTPWLALTNAGLCAKNTGLNEDAESYLRKALEANPDFSPALLEMAKLSLVKGQFMSARAFLQRFEAVSPPTPESLQIGIEAERALGNNQGVADYSKTLRSRYPESREASHLRRSTH